MMPQEDFDYISPFEQGSDDRFQGEPYDPSQSTDWKIGWHDTDRDLRALAAINRGDPCPVCAEDGPCVICQSEQHCAA